jgi:hypothetical protein
MEQSERSYFTSASSAVGFASMSRGDSQYLVCLNEHAGTPSLSKQKLPVLIP